MAETRILGIKMNERSKHAVTVQEILTKYGCTIRTRLGLNEVINDYCNAEGIILLELTGDEKEMDKLENELLAIEDIDVKKMVFE